MLKGIPPIISPELIKILMEMGHGDEICIADGNFPSVTYGKRVVRMDGHDIPEILSAVLDLFPLDSFYETPVILMAVPKEILPEPEIWETYHEIIVKSDEGKVFKTFKHIDSSAFYKRAEKCYAVIASSEQTLGANIILRKGII